jgi:hypothetical protein
LKKRNLQVESFKPIWISNQFITPKNFYMRIKRSKKGSQHEHFRPCEHLTLFYHFRPPKIISARARKNNEKRKPVEHKEIMFYKRNSFKIARAGEIFSLPTSVVAVSPFWGRN